MPINAAIIRCGTNNLNWFVAVAAFFCSQSVEMLLLEKKMLFLKLLPLMAKKLGRRQ